MRALHTSAPRGRKQGSAIVEFTLVGSFIFLPLLAGLASVGMSMVSGLEVQNLNANAGLMYSTGTDFTQAANVTMLQTNLAGYLNSTTSGGVLILTRVDGTTNGNSCSAQITIPIGTGGSGVSRYVPGGVGAVGTQFANLNVTLAVGQSVFIAETSYSNPLLAWALAPMGTSGGIYVENVF